MTKPALAHHNGALRATVIGGLIACLTFCTILLSGCAGPSPTDVSKEFFDAVKQDNTDTLQKTYSGEDSNLFKSLENEEMNALSQEENTSETSAQLQSEMDNTLLPKLRDFDYELSNEQINGDSATVDVKITTYAVGDAISSALNDYLSQGFTMALSGSSEEDLTNFAMQTFIDKFNNMEKSYTGTATVSLSKVDGNWKVDPIAGNSDLADLLSGGLLSYASSVQTATQASNAD